MYTHGIKRRVEQTDPACLIHLFTEELVVCHKPHHHSESQPLVYSAIEVFGASSDLRPLLIAKEGSV